MNVSVSIRTGSLPFLHVSRRSALVSRYCTTAFKGKLEADQSISAVSGFLSSLKEVLVPRYTSLLNGDPVSSVRVDCRYNRNAAEDILETCFEFLVNLYRYRPCFFDVTLVAIN